ncbi:MAG: hypothetical protein PHD31_02320 [Candidatus Pacebacteria bacterium]|nr:hypothetical protein [Candidatus Paceibacterota bacterium]
MSKKIILIIIVIIILGVANYFICKSITKTSSVIAPVQKVIVDAKNITYTIEGQEVTLVNGKSEVVATPGSASKIITQYFGNEVKADFNGDGVNDVVFLLTQDSGGSGTFYYVAVALSLGNSYKGTNAILLGDRIAPQTIQFQNGEIIVNYVDRKPDEPMTAIPSVGVSKYFKVSGGTLVRVQK